MAFGGSETVTLKAILQGTDRSLSATLRRSGGALGTFGKVAGVAAGAATTALLVAGTAAVTMASSFEESMSKISGLVGASKKDIDLYTQAVLDMSKRVPVGPQELADALYFVTSAGFKGKKALEVLETSAKGSAAGLGDTATVADAITSAINAYGQGNLSAAEAADILAGTVREGKAAAEDIAPVLGRILPLASELGVSFSDVGASLSAFTRVGDDASQASTKVSAILTSLVRQAPAGADVLKKVGLSYGSIRQEIREKGLLAALQHVSDKLGGNSSKLQKVFQDSNALKGVLALTGDQAEANKGIFERLATATGSLETAYDKASETLAFKTALLKTTVQSLVTEIGLKLLPHVKKLADWFMEKAVPAIEQFIDEWESGTGTGGEFRRELKKVWEELKSLWQWVQDNKDELKLLAQVILGIMLFSLQQLAVSLSAVVGLLKAVATVSIWLRDNVFKPVVSALLGGLSRLMGKFGAFFEAISYIPGFGWARVAADAMYNAAGAAGRLADNINGIPNYKRVTVEYNQVVLGRQPVYNQAGYRQGYTNVPRAGGGTIVPGMSYLVGENGPELFTSDAGGRITPARQTAQVMRSKNGAAGGGSGSDAPMYANLYLDGRLIQQSLLKRQRETGSLGFATS